MQVIVVGLGIMGSAAALHLAQRGHKVMGVDANSRGHKLGASHGTTRIIRQAYYEAPDYVPLLRRAYELWSDLEKQTNKELFLRTGGLFIGAETTELVKGSRASAQEHGIPHEYLNARQLKERYPFLALADHLVGVFEPTAGTLKAADCLDAQLDLATKYGAELQFDEPVESWSATASGVAVRTTNSIYEADALVITAGPWASRVLEDLKLPLTVRRVVNVYFEPDEPSRFGPDLCPIYAFHEADGPYVYGFPYFEGQGVKVGLHNPNLICTPETCDRTVHPDEIAELQRRLNKYLPGAGMRYLDSLTCLYTMTPDADFIVDRHPKHANVVYACGFSGHGFKFGSVMGEIMADLSTNCATSHPIGFLSANRFAAQNKH